MGDAASVGEAGFPGNTGFCGRIIDLALQLADKWQCGDYMYATISEETETTMASQGLLPLLVDTEGRSRKNAESEMRRLSHAMYCKTQSAK